MLARSGPTGRCIRDTQHAEVAFQRALEQLELARHLLHDYNQRAHFVEDKQPLYAELLALLAPSSNRALELLAYLERYKAQSLTDLLAAQPPDLNTEPAVKALLVERGRLRQQLDQRLTALLFSEAGLMSEVRQRGPALRAHDQYQNIGIAKLRGELQDLEERLTRQLPAAETWREGIYTAPEELLSQLPADTLLVSYYVAGAQLHAITATSDILSNHNLRLDLTDLEQRWTQAKRWITIPNKRLPHAQDHLAYFWEVLLAPLASQMRDKRSLLILPYRGLFHLPFAALYDRQHRRYLIEDWRVQIAPSLTLWRHCRQQPLALQPPLLIGCSGAADQPFHLPNVESEMTSLQTRMPQATLLLDDGATWERVWAELPGRSVVHFASHAVFDDHTPLESGILLAEGRWLRATDLYLRYNLLSGAVVVLSVCSGGRGHPAGSDILGLNTAFFYAGARSIIAGLWRVDDQATAQLMSEFYTQVQLGQDLAGALQAAQCKLLQSVTYAHPYYWGAFTLNGDCRLPSPQLNS